MKYVIELPEKFNQADLDGIADVIWWIKGYLAAVKDSYSNCPFENQHVIALCKAKDNLQEILRVTEGKDESN